MPRIYTRQIRSRGLLPNWDVMIKEVSAAMDREVKPIYLNYFQRIVEPWSEEHRPAFKARKTINKKGITLYVFPAGPNAWLWKLISITGSKEHSIEATNAPNLVFMWGGKGSYIPRTDTAGHYKGPGEVEGGHIRKPVIVDHPGFDPRNFEKFIVAWAKRKGVPRIIENAFRRGVRRAKAQARRL